MPDEIVDSSAPAEGTTVETPAAPEKEPAFDRAALEAKVTKGLAALRDDAPAKPAAEEPAEEPAADAEPQAGDEPAEEPAAEPVEGQEPVAEKGEGEEQEEQQPPAKKPTGPTLPAAYRRSLKAYDWSDEEIDSAFKADPSNFTVTAQKIHANRNAEMSRWAELGRTARTAQEQAVTQERAGKPAESPHVDPKTGLIRPVDVAAMVEELGNEEIVTKMAGPVNAAIERINALLPDLLKGVHSVNASRQEAMSRQIDGFFAGAEMKTFAEFYGKDSASMSEEQFGNRNKVLELADAMIAGAAQQGRKLTTDEALTLAHDSVGGSFRTQAIRKDIKTKVQTRAKGLTLKPSSRTAKTSTGPAKNAAELESRTKGRLSAIFGG